MYASTACVNTLFVLLVFLFLSPSETLGIGEGAVDTVLGCARALSCIYILPWWERGFMGPLARRAKAANLDYLESGLRYAALSRDRLTQDRKSTRLNSSH